MHYAMYAPMTILLAGLATLTVAAPAPVTPDIEPVEATARAKCLQDSESLKSWTVEGLMYRSSEVATSQDEDKDVEASVSFLLSNPFVSYKAACIGASRNLTDFTDGWTEYDCKVPQTQADAGHATRFSFSRSQAQIRIWQTWTCPGSSAKFGAKGSGNTTMHCSEAQWENPYWTQGAVFSTGAAQCNSTRSEAAVDQLTGVLRQ